MASVVLKEVDGEEEGMRLDRWFKCHYPQLSFIQLQKLLRSGQIRIDGKRAKAQARLSAGQFVRIPPLEAQKVKTPFVTTRTLSQKKDRDALEEILLYQDDKVFVFNKPAGLAVQGGSGLTRHIDGMLRSWPNKKGENPRLVHRLDRETSGVLVVARSKSAARFLTAAFRLRETKKIYWSLVRGVPKKREGKISSWLVKETTEQGDRVRVCTHGTTEADHAISYYRVIENSGRALSWLEMEPYTGRTHQLRVHAASIGHPIIGDNKYFFADQNWQLPGGVQNKLHLHAYHIIIPHPSGGVLDVVAPLSVHMQQSFNLLGFDINTPNAKEGV